MTAKLFDLLPDFGASRPVDADPGRSRDRRAQPEGAPSAPAGFGDDLFAEPAIDIEAIRAEAFRKGRLEAFEESAALHQADLDIERQRHREALEDVRARYEQDYATVIASRFDQLAHALSEVIGAQVGEVLAPFLDARIQRTVVAELAEAIKASMNDNETAAVSVTGPPGLHEGLKAHFNERNVSFSFVETDELDLTVEFDGTLFTTRLGEWSEALKEALA
jgi:hypothetical protein